MLLSTLEKKKKAIKTNTSKNVVIVFAGVSDSLSKESAKPMLPFFRCKTSVQMLHFHSGEELESWMQAAFPSTNPELRSFVYEFCIIESVPEPVT